MKQIRLFNPEHDLALANGDRYFIAPRNIREMANDLAHLMEIITPSDRTDSILRLHPSSINKSVDFSAVLPFPWGWDPAVTERFKKMGIPTELLPTDEALAALSRRSERSTAHLFLQTFRQAHPDEIYLGESIIAHTFEEIANYAESHKHILLKAPLSGSGKGLRHVNILNENKPYDGQESNDVPLLCKPKESAVATNVYSAPALKKVETWANALIRRHGYLTAEPFYNKIQDFAMEFIADTTGCHFIGYSYFITDTHGRYIGSRLMSDTKAENLLCGYVPREALHEVRQWITTHYADIIPNEWDTTHHPLPFGIDMMITCENQQSTDKVRANERNVNFFAISQRVQTNLSEANRQQTEENSRFSIVNSQFKIHPCIEINLRMNMGIIAHEIYHHRLTPDAEGMFYIARFTNNAALHAFHKEHTQRHPAIYYEGRLSSGYATLTPIGVDTTHLAYIICD